VFSHISGLFLLFADVDLIFQAVDAKFALKLRKKVLKLVTTVRTHGIKSAL